MTIEDEYSFQNSKYGLVTGDVIDDLKRKYKLMGIPVNTTKIIELRNERTGVRLLQRVKEND